MTTPPASEHPKVSYHPILEEWHARTARRLTENPSLPLTPLPEGFPRKLQSPLVWEGKDWHGESQWVYDLSKYQLQEINDAVQNFHSLKTNFGHISPATFPLPTLGPVLRGLAHELHSGRGFFVLRTIPVASYSRADNVLIHAGISSYIGVDRGVQDKDGGVLGHVTDLTRTSNTIRSTPYTADKQVYHIDPGADVVALYTLETAMEGGTSRISSTWRIYNELAETRPDLINTLAEPWVFDGYGEDKPLIIRPLLFHHDSKLIIHYGRRFFISFEGLTRSSNIPPITEGQAEVLDALHFIAEKHSLELTLQKGDIQFINNLSISHMRDGYKDDPEHPRHLLRMWLRNEELGWKIPEPLQPLWEETFAAIPEEQTFALEPVIRAAITSLMDKRV